MRYFGLAAGFWCATWCCSAKATSLRYLSLQQLVDQSSWVVRAHPLRQSSFWQDGRILTQVRVRVDEAWVGDARVGSEVDVMTLGGTVGGIGQRVDGAAVLPTGRDMVLQLARDAAARLWPVGLAQGVWILQPAAMAAQHGDHADRTPIRIGRPHTDRLVRAASDAPGIMPQTLDELRAAVREAAHGR